jgi:hypothetical protein
VSHCLYIFSRSALIDCLLHNDHERLEHCALRLEAYTESHQVAWGSYYCDWARTLSAWHSGQRDEATRSHLMGLESRAIQLGLSREARLVGAALFQPGVEPVRANSVPRSTHTR